MPDINPDEWLLSTGIRSASFQNVGEFVVGLIARQPEVQQQRDFETGELKFWSDGNPMMQLRVVLTTDQRDPEDPEDSGERAVYIRGNMQRAVAQAVRAAGAKGLAVGGKLLIKYSGDGKAARRGLNAPKLYEAKYRPPASEPTPVPEPPAGQRAARRHQLRAGHVRRSARGQRAGRRPPPCGPPPRAAVGVAANGGACADLAAAVAAARGVHVAAEAEEIVAAAGMTMADLRAPSRKREIVEVRRIVAIYLRQRGCSLPEIGRVLSRDHSTVLHLLWTTPRTETRCA